MEVVDDSFASEDHVITRSKLRFLVERVLPHIIASLLLIVGLYFWFRPILQLLDGYWHNHTTLYDFYRAAGVVEAWRGGIWDGRWFPSFDGGYGYPFLSFYPPLLHWTSAALSIHFDSISKGVRLALGLWMAIGTFGVYVAGQRFWSLITDGRMARFLPGFFAAAGWMMAPYLLMDVYIRGSGREFVSAQLLGWVMWASLGIVSRVGDWRAKDMLELLLLIAAVTAGILAHSYFGMAVFGFGWVMIPFCLVIRIIRHRGMTGFGNAAFRSLALCAALSFCLLTSLFYTFPAMVEDTYVQVYKMTMGYFEYAQHFIEWENLKRVALWDFGSSFMGPEDSLPLHLGFVSVLTVSSVVIGLYGVWFGRWKGKGLTFLGVLVLLAATITSLLLITSVSTPIWEAVTLLQWGQFPWRLMPLTAFGVALLLPTALIMFEPRGRTLFLAFSIFLIHVIIFFVFSLMHYGKPLLDYKGDEHSIKLDRNLVIRTADVDEFGPLWRDTVARTQPFGEFVTEEGMHAEFVGNKSDFDMSLRITNELDRAGHMSVAFNYYPYWKAYYVEEEKPALIYPHPQTGEIVIGEIPPGENVIRLRLDNTQLRKRSLAVSMGAWIIWLLGFLLTGIAVIRRRFL